MIHLCLFGVQRFPLPAHAYHYSLTRTWICQDSFSKNGLKPSLKRLRQKIKGNFSPRVTEKARALLWWDPAAQMMAFLPFLGFASLCHSLPGKAHLSGANSSRLTSCWHSRLVTVLAGVSGSCLTEPVCIRSVPIPATGHSHPHPKTTWTKGNEGLGYQWWSRW